MTRTLVSRRQMLQATALGGLHLAAVPGMVAAGVDANRPLGRGAADKSLILVWLCGGPSHLDTWDLKPDAPEGIRGPRPGGRTASPSVGNPLAGCQDAPRERHGRGLYAHGRNASTTHR